MGDRRKRLEQVISRVLFLSPAATTKRKAMIIPLVPLLPMGSSNLPESLDGPPSRTLLFGLAPGGVCQASDVTTGTGELLPHRFTLTPTLRGGLLSVALSCSSPRLGITQHPALRSPDFPPALFSEDQRSFALLQSLICNPAVHWLT